MNHKEIWSMLFWRFILQRMYNVYMFRRIFPQKWVRSYALWHSLIHLHQYRFMLKHGYEAYLIHPMSLAQMSYRFMTLYMDRNINWFDLELVYYSWFDPFVESYYKTMCFIWWKTTMINNFELNPDLPTGRR